MSYFARKVLCLILLSVPIGACSGQRQINLTLILENARAPAGLHETDLPEIQRVQSFVVTISGSDLSEDVVTSFSAETASMQVQDIPEGETRTLTVEALNSEGMVVRRRALEEITIDKDTTEPIVVSLNTVPLFTNLRDGNRIIVSRVRIRGVGEPGGRVVLEDSFNGSISPLLDISSDDVSLSTSAGAGDFNLVPASMNLGTHSLLVRDPDTEEFSEIKVRVVPAGSLPGTGLSAYGASAVGHVVSGGTPYGGMNNQMGNFSNILVRMTQ